MAYCSFEIKGKAPFVQIFTNSRFFTVGLLQMANDKSSATAATRRAACNRDGPPPFAAAHG
jgi:hypothetical protein